MTRFPRRAVLLAGIVLTLASNTLAHKHKQHDKRVLEANPALALDPIAPALSGLGTHHHPITTSSADAQKFFDQGLKLTYAFNHQEALRAFKDSPYASIRITPWVTGAGRWFWALT